MADDPELGSGHDRNLAPRTFLRRIGGGRVTITRVTSLARHRRAAAVAFASQGLVFISLTTRLPDTTDRWDLGELELSLLLLMMVLLAGGGSVLAERLAAHRDSAWVLRVGLLVTAVAVPALLLSPVFGGFVAGLAAYGVALGLVDATTNMQGVAVERGWGRPLLPSFHGAWTFGGLVGAGLTLATSGPARPDGRGGRRRAVGGGVRRR